MINLILWLGIIFFSCIVVVELATIFGKWIAKKEFSFNDLDMAALVLVALLILKILLR